MVRVWTFSEASGDRPNEDAFAVKPHPLDPDLMICVVADGQGGRAGGGPAARLACQTAMDLVTSLSPERVKRSPTWVSLLRRADEAVRADAVAGFTTLVGLCASAERIVGASCGDSAALLVTGNDAFELTTGQHKNPPLGSGVAHAETFDVVPGEPWQLLALTDGVWKYVGWERVIEAARRDRGAATLAELQRAARLPGSGRFQDDFTVVLLESGPAGMEADTQSK